MIFVYIFAPILLLIILGKWANNSVKKEKLQNWLLELNQWEIGDTVEIGKTLLSLYPKSYSNTYYCVQHNDTYTQAAYYDAAQ
jgi:hypothetical protein